MTLDKRHTITARWVGRAYKCDLEAMTIAISRIKWLPHCIEAVVIMSQLADLSAIYALGTPSRLISLASANTDNFLPSSIWDV